MEKQKPKKRIPITAFAKKEAIEIFKGNSKKSEAFQNRLRTLCKQTKYGKYTDGHLFGKFIEKLISDPESVLKFVEYEND